MAIFQSSGQCLLPEEIAVERQDPRGQVRMRRSQTTVCEDEPTLGGHVNERVIVDEATVCLEDSLPNEASVTGVARADLVFGNRVSALFARAVTRSTEMSRLSTPMCMRTVSKSLARAS
ncbi:hypothetical protein ATO8_19309 [Roseivivax marinus]|uniref:Uncharacterized protein n=1 Tax=Roseivivax marinus TaxID=1379903 RepID=W4HFU2_9RHOB|nr:hypothetical protein ATO8_19309 [Roseivivax marinus]